MAVSNQCAPACGLRVSVPSSRHAMAYLLTTRAAILLSRNAHTIPLKASPSRTTLILGSAYGCWRNRYVSSSRAAPHASQGQRRLTDTLAAQLKSQLHETRHFDSRSASPSRHAQLIRNGNHFASTSSNNGRSPAGSPNGGGIILPHASLDVLQQLSPDSTDSHPRGSTGSPELRHGNQHHVPDPFMDVLFAGWDPDLPDPDTLDH